MTTPSSGVVPQVEREEFINVGCHPLVSGSPVPRYARTPRRRRGSPEAFAPTLDEAVVRSHLASFEAVCRGGTEAGPIGALPARQRFHWLVAPRSTVIQTSPAHTGWCRDPEETLERLLRQYVIVNA